MSFSIYPISEHFGQTLDNLIAINNFDHDNPLFQRIREENFSNLFPYSIQLAPPGQGFDFNFPVPSFPEISMIPNVAFLDQQMLYERNFTVEESLGNPYTEIASENLRNYELFAETSFTPQEYIQYQQNRQLLSPNSPVMTALGLKGYDLGFTHAFVDLHSIDSAEDFKQKTAAICSQIEHNRTFWCQTLDTFLPVNPDDLSFSWAKDSDMRPKREYLTGEGCTDEEQIEMVLDRLQELQEEKEEFALENAKYAFISNVPSASSEQVQTVPYADDPQANQSGFKQALEDQKHIEIFQRNRALYPEGAEERLSDDYLEENLKGLPGTVGGNFGYFSGSLVSHMGKLGLTDSNQTNGLFANLTSMAQELNGSTQDNKAEFFGMLEKSGERVRDKVITLKDDAKKFFEHRWDIISTLDVRGFFKDEANYLKSAFRGISDIHTQCRYYFKKLDLQTPSSEAKQYLNDNLLGPTEEIGGSLGYRLGQMAYVTSLALGLQKLRGIQAIKDVPLGLQKLIDHLKPVNILDSVKPLSPIAQKELLNNCLNFLTRNTQNFLKLCPSGLLPTAAMLRYGGDIVQSGQKIASNVQDAWKTNQIAKSEGFKLLHAHVDGVPSKEVILSARNALDQMGKTGKIGENLKLLDRRLANQVYCVQNIKEYGIVADVIEANKPMQVHHALTNKNIVGGYTEIFESRFAEYGLKLSDPINKILMPHIGPHDKLYHAWCADRLNDIHEVAEGNVEVFKELFVEHIITPIRENPLIVTVDHWMKITNGK